MAEAERAGREGRRGQEREGVRDRDGERASGADMEVERVMQRLHKRQKVERGRGRRSEIKKF